MSPPALSKNDFLVLRAMREFAEPNGWCPPGTIARIGKTIGWDASTVSAAAIRLEAELYVEAAGKSAARRYRILPRALTSGAAESRASDDGQKERKCLRCQNVFVSEWSGNRLCLPCNIYARREGP